MKKNLAVACLAAIGVAAVVGLTWLWVYVAAYRYGRYDLPFFVTQVDQLLVSSIAGAATFAVVLWRSRRGPDQASVGAALASAVFVSGGVGLLWAGLWAWMARYYSPTHTRIDMDIPWLTLSWESLPFVLVALLPAAFVIVGLALFNARRTAT